MIDLLSTDAQTKDLQLSIAIQDRLQFQLNQMQEAGRKNNAFLF
jgi:hypothetical protein